MNTKTPIGWVRVKLLKVAQRVWANFGMSRGDVLGDFLNSDVSPAVPQHSSSRWPIDLTVAP